MTDTQYMSRIAQRYLKVLYTQEERASKVMASSGQVTSLLRGKWGLNGLLKSSKEPSEIKERGDHRHHAIDAFVIGCTTRRMLQKIAEEAHRVETNEHLYGRRKKLVETMPEPYEGYLQQVEEKLDRLIVSHRPDHRHASRAMDKRLTVGALHEETAYGLIIDPEKRNEKNRRAVTRKTIESFKTLKDADAIVDSVWRAKLREVINNNSDLPLKERLINFSKKENIRRLRVFATASEFALIGIFSCAQSIDRDPKPYKYYKSGNNYCAEIYCPSMGKEKGKWYCEIVNNYQVHQRGFIAKWRKEDPTSKLIMRLQINDMVSYEKDGQTHTARIKKMTNGRVYLLDHTVANGQEQGWAASAQKLKEVDARKVYVDIMGQVKKPYKSSVNLSR